MKKIAVTGADGFVGKVLCESLENKGYDIKRIVRSISDGKINQHAIGDITEKTCWRTALSGADVVVHLVARVHVMNDIVGDKLSEYRNVNTYATESLAKAAEKYGVKQFIYLSSVKVNGECSGKGKQNKFSEKEQIRPLDPYAVSKYEAEERLRDIDRTSNLSVTIIRPPLVYGPGVKANFFRLMNIVERGIPLPLLAVKNKRSMVSVFNLVDFIIACIDNPQASGETFLISDNNDLSTVELVRAIATAMNKPARLFFVPIWMLDLLGNVVGKRPELHRLTRSLQVDINKVITKLNWEPPVSVEDGIKRTVSWYLGAKK